MGAALRLLERYAPLEQLPVLVEGESGTGKSYVARALHLRSPRGRGPFHQVLLSSLDDNLAASDLFGHLSGAYTDARQSRPGHFVSANGGTLFLDEIGKASFAVQRKLLHAVEHQEVWPVGADRSVRLNVRLVTATNVSLERLVELGEFLPDLAARLSNFRIRLPALRERRQDIPELEDQFLRLRAPQLGIHGKVPRVSDEVMQALQLAEWPNNLRQLDATVQRLLIEGQEAAEITLAHCVEDLAYLRGLVRGSASPLTPALVRERMAALQSVAETARSLGVSRWTVYRYLDRSDHVGDASRSGRAESTTLDSAKRRGDAHEERRRAV